MKGRCEVCGHELHDEAKCPACNSAKVVNPCTAEYAWRGS